MDQYVSFFGLNLPEWTQAPVLFTGALSILAIRPVFNFLTRTSLNPDGKPAEANHFGGPIGGMMMPGFLMSICLFLYYGCNAQGVISLDPRSELFFKFAIHPFADGLCAFFRSLWNLDVFLVYSAWVIGHWVLYLAIPGKYVQGTILKNKSGDRLTYKINALQCNFVSLAILVALVYFGILPATYGYDNFLHIIGAAFVFTFSLSVLLYVHSIVFIPRTPTAGDENPLEMLSFTGNSGNVFYDFWMGRTLNPRLGFIDLKYVNELRPGLILWYVLNFSFAAKQLELHGSISPSMILICLFHFMYVVDSHLHEEAILTTMDITTDGFGFMLCFGDLAWVPLNYSLQARYLVDYDPALSYPVLAGITVLMCIGFYIFRSSNNEKNAFRTNPESPKLSHLRYLTTKTGRKLLISSWWGKSRHINYFGDLLLGTSWCLVTGFNAIMPYFYIVYFTALLLDRQIRDDESCKEKYGEDWDKYCEIVPSRIVPGLY